MTRNIKPFATRVRELIATANGELKSVVFDVGPKDAEFLLGLSRGNRTESSLVIDKYRRDILAGHWVLTHQGLGIDAKGSLVDGHHRMRAVIAANKPIRTMVTFGLPAKAIEGADMGRARSIAAQLRLRDGQTPPTLLIAAVRMAMMLESDIRGLQCAYSLGEIKDGLAHYREAIASLGIETRKKFPASMWGTLVFAYPVAPELITSFAEDLVRGTDLPRGSPAFCLREYLRIPKGNTATEKRAIIARTLYAVKATVEGRPLTKFSPRGEDGVRDWVRKLKDET